MCLTFSIKYANILPESVAIKLPTNQPNHEVMKKFLIINIAALGAAILALGACAPTAITQQAHAPGSTGNCSPSRAAILQNSTVNKSFSVHFSPSLTVLSGGVGFQPGFNRGFNRGGGFRQQPCTQGNRGFNPGFNRGGGFQPTNSYSGMLRPESVFSQSQRRR